MKESYWMVAESLSLALSSAPLYGRRAEPRRKRLRKKSNARGIPYLFLHDFQAVIAPPSLEGTRKPKHLTPSCSTAPFYSTLIPSIPTNPVVSDGFVCALLTEMPTKGTTTAGT